jgi:hypothetical protein
MVLVLFRSDYSFTFQGFSASLALKSSGDYGPFPSLPDPNTIKFKQENYPFWKPVNPLPYPFDASGDLLFYCTHVFFMPCCSLAPCKGLLHFY